MKVATVVVLTADQIEPTENSNVNMKETTAPNIAPY
jgi:hypothetical protein